MGRPRHEPFHNASHAENPYRGPSFSTKPSPFSNGTQNSMTSYSTVHRAATKCCWVTTPKAISAVSCNAPGNTTEVELVGIESPLFPKTGIGSGWVTHEIRTLPRHHARRPGPNAARSMACTWHCTGPWRCAASSGRRPTSRDGAPGRWRGRHPKRRSIRTQATRTNSSAQAADLAFCVEKYFPHYDHALAGRAPRAPWCARSGGNTGPRRSPSKFPILTPTVLQWTGGTSPWLQLVHRAPDLAREPDAYVNVFFGFPLGGRAPIGMTIQTLTNGPNWRSGLRSTWPRPERGAPLFCPMPPADRTDRTRRGQLSARNRQRQRAGRTADHYSDRSGAATWTFARAQGAPAQGGTLIAKVADYELVRRARATRARVPAMPATSR